MTTVKIKIWLTLFIIGAIQTYYLNAEVRVVCYYTNWSVYRPGTAKFNPQNINPYLCTHLIYAFGGFTKDNTLKPFDKYQDIEKGGYAKFTGLKTYNKNLKTLIAIGGWNEGSSRFSSLVASSEKRKEFVKNVVKFLRVNHFDGLDLDWEYPSFRDGGKPRDKDNYCQLVQELREEFEREASKTGRPKLLLTMAVPAGIEYIKKGFDVEKLNKYLDWMNILSYDYHSAFEPSVNHHAPLYPLEEDNEYNYDAELNIDHTIKYYLEAGADRQKLVLGIPTYGRSYTLFNPDANELGAPADGPGEMGDATKEKGYLAYYEICENVKSNPEWTVVQPNPEAMGPYAYKDDQWVGYDDESIVRLKAKYVAEQDLGGIMFWSIDNDDFRGKCNGRPYPLIEAAKEALIESSSNLITTEERVVTRTRTRPLTSKNIASSVIVQNSGGRQTITQKNRSRGGNRFASRNQNQFDDDAGSTTLSKGSTRRRVSESRSKQNQRRQSQRRSTTTTTTTTTTTSSPLSIITPSYTTPPPPATPDSGSDFKCEDEGFFPHPSDCKKYYWCLSSGPSELGIVAHAFTCPAGLYFNKAADSCDYSRNVLCNKKLKTTTTTTTSTTTTAQPKTVQSTTTPRTTTQRTRAPITAATSRTTLRLASSTSTTPIPDEYEDDEYVYYDDDEEDDGAKKVFDSEEEDPKVIKELIALIKKVGGVQELEKQLFSTDGSTTPATISKSLYERVLSVRNNNNNAPGAQFGGESKNIFGTTKTRTTNFRNGVQFRGSEEESVSRGKPQYVTINRSSQRTSNDDDESIENSRTNTNFNSEARLIQTDSNSNSKLPSYVTIARGSKNKLVQSSTSEESEAVSRNQEQRRQNSNQFRTNSEMPAYVTIARGTSSRVQNEENVDSAEDDSSDEEELNVKTTFNSGSERRFVNRLETVKNVNMPEYVSTTNFRTRTQNEQNLPDTSSELNTDENEGDSQTIFSSSKSSNLSKQNSETSTSKYQTLNRSRSSFVSSSTSSNLQTQTSDEATTDQTLLLSIKDNGPQNQKESVVVAINEFEKDVSDTEDEITGTTETVDILLKPLLNIPVFSEETNQTSVEKTIIETETSKNDKTVPLLQQARPFSITQKSILDEQINENTTSTSTLKVSENQTTANDVVYTSRGTLLTPHGFVLGHNGSTNSNNNNINNITKIEYTIIDNKNKINHYLNETNEIKNNRVPIVRIASDNRFATRNNSRFGVRVEESTNDIVNETDVLNVSRNRFRIQDTSYLQSNQTETSTQNRPTIQDSTELQSNQTESFAQNRFRTQGTSTIQSNQTDTSKRFGFRQSSNTAQNRFRVQETSTEAQNQTETVTQNRFTGRRVVSRFRTTSTPSPSSETTKTKYRGRGRGTLATTTQSVDEEDLNESVERTYRPKSTFRDLSSLTAVDFNARAQLNGNNRFRISRRRPARPAVTTTTLNTTESSTPINRTSTFGTRRQSISNENESIRTRTITTETTQDTASRNYVFRPRGNRISAVRINVTETQSEETQNNGENVTEITSIDDSSTESSINETSIEHDENEQIHLSETNIRETESIGRDVNQIVKPIEITTRRRKIIRKVRPIASTIDFTTETNELIMVDNVDARVSVAGDQSVTEPNIIVRTRKIIRKLRPVVAIQDTELEQNNSALINNNSSSNSNSSENLVTQQRSQTTRFTSQRNRTFSRPTQTVGTITVQNRTFSRPTSTERTVTLQNRTFSRPTQTDGAVTIENTSRRRYQSNNFNRFGTRPRLEVLRTSSSLNSEITRNSFEETTSKSLYSKLNQNISEESTSQSKLESNSESNGNNEESTSSQSILLNSDTQNNFNEARSQLLTSSNSETTQLNNEARSQLLTSSNSETTRLNNEGRSQLLTSSNSETTRLNNEARSQLLTSSNSETTRLNNEARSQSTLSAFQTEKQNEEYENQKLTTTESNDKEDVTTASTMDDTTDLISEITTTEDDNLVTINENDDVTSPVAITTDDYGTTLNTFEEDESLTSNSNETSIEKQTTTTTTSTPSRLFRRPSERTSSSINRSSYNNRRESVVSTSSESTRVNGFRRRFTTARPSTTATYPTSTRRRTVYRQFTPRTSTRTSSFGNRRRNQTNEVVELNEIDEYNSVHSNDEEASINLSSSSSRNYQTNNSKQRIDEASNVSNRENIIQNERLNKIYITANQEKVISQINSENSGVQSFSNQNEYSEVNTYSTDDIDTTELNTESQLNIELNQNGYVENELSSRQNNEQIELTTSSLDENSSYNTNEQEISGYELRQYSSESNIGSSQIETEDSNIQITEETNYGLKKTSSGIKTSQLEQTTTEFLTETSPTPTSIVNEKQTSSLDIGYSTLIKNQSTSTSKSSENSEDTLLIHHVFAEPTTEYPGTTKNDLIDDEGIKKNQQRKLIEVNRYVEVNYKEDDDDDTKNKTSKIGTMLDMDKIGEINRVTVIKIVDGNITQTGDENLFLSETSALRNFLNSTRPVTITTKIRASNKTVPDNGQNDTVNDLLTAHLQAIENALVNEDAKNGRKIRIDSQSRVANTYTLQPDFTEITTLALEALFHKDKQPTTSTSRLVNDIQTPLPTLKQVVTSDNQLNESQNKLLNIQILKQDEDDGSRSLKFSDDANILPIRILNENKPEEVNDETKIVYLLKNSPFIDSEIRRENRSPLQGLNIKSDKMGGFLTTTKSTTLSVPYFRKNLLRRNQTTSILKKRIVNETTTTELPTTTVNQSLQKLRNRTFKPRSSNNLSNNKTNNATTKSLTIITSTTTAKPNTNRFRFATRKVSVFRSTTQRISASTERNDQDIEPSNHKSLNSKNLLDPDTVVADDIVLAIHNIQAAPIRTSVEVNRNPKNIRYRPTTVRSLPKTRLKTIDQLPIIEEDVAYAEDDTDTIKILGKDISKGKVLIHPSGKIQCLDQGNFPHPVSCRKFISCAKMENGAVIGWEYTCPKNLSFDPIGGICNWAAGLGCVS